MKHILPRLMCVSIESTNILSCLLSPLNQCQYSAFLALFLDSFAIMVWQFLSHEVSVL